MIKSKINSKKDLFEQLKAIKEAFGSNISIKLLVIDKDVLVVEASKVTQEDILSIDLMEQGDLSLYKNYFG